MSWTKQKWGKRNSNSILDTQIWKVSGLLRVNFLHNMMIADLYFSLQFEAICGFSAKGSNTLQLKNKTKKEQTNKKPNTKSANEHEILRATSPQPYPSLHGWVLGLSLWRIQSLPGNRTLWRTISAMMHPTDQMSTTKYQVIKKQPESFASLFLNHLPNLGSPRKHSSGGTLVNLNDHF